MDDEIERMVLNSDVTVRSREVTIITNLSSHIPTFIRIDMINVAKILVLTLFNQNS